MHQRQAMRRLTASVTLDPRALMEVIAQNVWQEHTKTLQAPQRVLSVRQTQAHLRVAPRSQHASATLALRVPTEVLARNVWLESSRLQLVTSLVQTVVQDTIPQRWAPRQMHAWNARQTLTRQQLVTSARTVFATLGQLGLMVVYVPSVLRANTRLILAMLLAQPALRVSIPRPLVPHPMYAKSVLRTPMPLKQVTNKVTALATLDTRARMGVFVRNV